MIDRESAQARLQSVAQQIKDAEQAAGRASGSVCLVGAAKQQAPSLVADFCRAGLRELGHNYLQEALVMKQALADLEPAPTWHFIGAIQSNKTKDIAQQFDWVHSVDRFKIARRLSKQRQALSDTKLNILLQVNLDGEDSKAGVLPDQVLPLAEQCLGLSGISLRGFMALPEARTGLEQQRRPFKQLRQLLEACNAELGTEMDNLSMGMSNDLEAAILEGSTMVRVGTALFGARS